jgi:phage shock protein PspC (stress-responsive transcriptional regulator)
MSVSDELGKLGELHQRGILSDDEFARAKARILDGTAVPRGDVAPAPGINALRRSLGDRWIGGVCGGLAQITGLASWIWRLIFVLAVVFAGTGLLLYVLMWIFVPEEQLYLPAPRPNAG